jgi:quercetin dioxygenase-like cupin family protein
MAGIILIRDGEHEWQEAPAEWQARRREGDAGLAFKRLLASAPGRANMQRTRYHPHHHEAPHSHPEDEIIFVLDGVVAFGRDELRFGDAIFVPRDTIYSLHTGETGAEFLRVGFSDLAAPPAGEQP